MRWHGPIVNSLISLAAVGVLSACTAHHHGHGTVYRPHEYRVPTGPVRTQTHTTTRTTIITPRHGGDRYRRRGRHYRGPDDHAPPIAAQRRDPPAHGLHGTQPGHLKRKKHPVLPGASTPRRHGTQPSAPVVQSPQQPQAILTPQRPRTVSSAMTQQKKTGKSTILTQPNATILTEEPR